MLFLQGKTDEVLHAAVSADGRGGGAGSSSRRRRASATRSRGSTSCNRGSSSRARRPATSTSSRRSAERGLVALNVVMVRGGRHVGDRTFFPRHAEGSSLADVVCAFLEQHYVERPVPPTIIVPEALDTDGAGRSAVGAERARRSRSSTIPAASGACG